MTSKKRGRVSKKKSKTKRTRRSTIKKSKRRKTRKRRMRGGASEEGIVPGSAAEKWKEKHRPGTDDDTRYSNKVEDLEAAIREAKALALPKEHPLNFYVKELEERVKHLRTRKIAELTSAGDEHMAAGKHAEAVASWQAALLLSPDDKGLIEKIDAEVQKRKEERSGPLRGTTPPQGPPGFMENTTAPLWGWHGQDEAALAIDRIRREYNASKLQAAERGQVARKQMREQQEQQEDTPSQAWAGMAGMASAAKNAAANAAANVSQVASSSLDAINSWRQHNT